jgi:hypothetical protein
MELCFLFMLVTEMIRVNTLKQYFVKAEQFGGIQRLSRGILREVRRHWKAALG